MVLKKRLCVLCAGAFLTAAVAGEPAELVIHRFTVDGGGAMRSSGGNFELSATVGQPDAGVQSGNGFTLAGGFWFGSIPCDCNEDGGINLYDYDAFQACLSGPEGRWGDPTCACFDRDSDRDVDAQDAATFQRFFSGG